MDEAQTDPKPAFHASFTSSIKALEDAISALPSLRTASQQQSAISDVLAKITVLTHDLKDAAVFLPGYDQKVYSEQLKATSESLSAARKAVAPRTKFSFKNRRATGPSEPAAAPSPSTSASASASASTSTSTSKSTPSAFPSIQTSSLTSLTNTYTSPPPPTATTTILSLSNLTNCIVTPPEQPASKPPAEDHNNTNTNKENPEKAEKEGEEEEVEEVEFTTLSLSSITSSILILPRIKGPAHLTSLSKTVLVLSCHQFRLHDSTDVDVYLSCTSHPIIERSRGIRVCRLPENFESLRGVREDRDMWDSVEDFNWLKEGKRSPNWRVMEAGEGVGEDEWRGIILRETKDPEEVVRRFVPGLLN